MECLHVRSCPCKISLDWDELTIHWSLQKSPIDVMNELNRAHVLAQLRLHLWRYDTFPDCDEMVRSKYDTVHCADNNSPSIYHRCAPCIFRPLLTSHVPLVYKKHVVSLGNKLVEKDVKAEQDGWSVFKSGLAIERSPFELLFYDFAHVSSQGKR